MSDRREVLERSEVLRWLLTLAALIGLMIVWLWVFYRPVLDALLGRHT